MHLNEPWGCSERGWMVLTNGDFIWMQRPDLRNGSVEAYVKGLAAGGDELAKKAIAYSVARKMLADVDRGDAVFLLMTSGGAPRA